MVTNPHPERPEHPSSEGGDRKPPGGRSDEVVGFLRTLLPRIRDVSVLEGTGPRWHLRALKEHRRYRRLLRQYRSEVQTLRTRYNLARMERRYPGYLEVLPDLLRGELTEPVRVPPYWRYVPFRGSDVAWMTVLAGLLGDSEATVVSRSPVPWMAGAFRVPRLPAEVRTAVADQDFAYLANVFQRAWFGWGTEGPVGLSERGVVYVPVWRRARRRFGLAVWVAPAVRRHFQDLRRAVAGRRVRDTGSIQTISTKSAKSTNKGGRP